MTDCFRYAYNQTYSYVPESNIVKKYDNGKALSNHLVRHEAMRETSSSG